MMRERFAHEIPRRFQSAPGPSDELYERVRAAIVTTPADRLALGQRLTLAALALPAAVVLVLGARHAMSDRPIWRLDLGSNAPAHLVLQLVLLCALTVVCTHVASRPAPHGLGSPPRVLLATGLAVAPVYALLTLLIRFPSDDPHVVAATSRLHPWGLPCATIAAFVGVAAIAALGWALRRAVPAAATLRGAAVGAASGAWAGLALFVHCPAADLRHMLVAHVAPIVVFTVLGTLIVPRLART